MRLLLPVLLLAAGACAIRPVLYPNEKYNQAGKEQSQKDIDECRAWAKQYAKTEAGRKAVSGAATGAAAGAAGGAVAGAMFGSLGRGAASGGAGGAAVGLVSAIAHAGDPSPAQRNLTDRCLRDRGYEVAGWQ